MSDLRLAVVGCGAAARGCHLPAIPRVPGVRLTALVDPDLAHAAEAAEVYRAAGGSLDGLVRAATLADALPHFDAAVVAAPHTLHAALADVLLDSGKHVLMEKPMAVRPGDAARIACVVGRAPRIVFAMAHPRRLFPASVWVRNLLATGQLGRIRRIDWREGHPYSWNPTTASMFAPGLAGGGVLTDTGSHVFDLLLWWLGPDVVVLDYLDNSLGGVETDARAVLGWGEIEVHVEFSRLRPVGTVCAVTGTSATATIGTGFPAATRTLVDAGGRTLPAGDVPDVPNTWRDLFARQLHDFTAAVGGAAIPQATADDGRRVIELINSCYRIRRAWPQPWLSRTTPRARSYPRVAVTGASGFIGGRVVEKLILETTTPVRAIVRGFGRLARLSLLPQERLEFTVADITDQQAMIRALTGCSVVVHCARGNTGTPQERRHTTVQGTATVLAAARTAGVHRLIHLSDHPATERLLLAANPPPESVVLRPGPVYGPWSQQRPDNTIYGNATSGEATSGDAIYVDDIVDIIFHILDTPHRSGQHVLFNPDHAVRTPRHEGLALLESWIRWMGYPSTNE